MISLVVAPTLPVHPKDPNYRDFVLALGSFCRSYQEGLSPAGPHVGAVHWERGHVDLNEWMKIGTVCVSKRSKSSSLCITTALRVDTLL